MTSSISVIIPAYQPGQHLIRCLEALRASDPPPLEILVVEDGGKSETLDKVAAPTTRILRTDRRRGPAFARNLGAKAARGDILFFLDADVCVTPNTIARIVESFDADPSLDALMGSYDSEPGSRDFISQYRNLMHSYVHHQGTQQASTFWSGCGAIRRELFLEHSGFNERYGRPSIEDIELGYRLIRAGRKIVLDHTIEVTHLKRWTFWGVVKTDILDRGIPWTELILRDWCMPNDLNLQLSQRVSVALVFLLVGLSSAMAIVSGGFLLIPLFAIVFLMLASWWVELASCRRPRTAYAMFTCVVAIIALLAYTHRMPGLIAPLLVSPAMLLLTHRYRDHDKVGRILHRFGVAYILFSMSVAIFYLPVHGLLFAAVPVLVLLGLLNNQFYVFLAAKRSVPFMLAAIPFHLLYHFYNGVSFIIGLVHYSWMAAFARARPQPHPNEPGTSTAGPPFL
jgi:hypothetical protein